MAMNNLKSITLVLILKRLRFIPVQMTPNRGTYNIVYTNIVQIYSNMIFVHQRPDLTILQVNTLNVYSVGRL